MYKKETSEPIKPETFELSSLEKLDENNRWVIMSELIPWSEFEEEYAANFDQEMGAPAKSFRMALGGLLNKGRKVTEKIIDILYNQRKGILKKKPKTYRKKARKEYLKVAKRRNLSREKIKEGIKKQIENYKKYTPLLPNFSSCR